MSNTWFRLEVLSLLLETKFPLQRIFTDRLDAVTPQRILEVPTRMETSKRRYAGRGTTIELFFDSFKPGSAMNSTIGSSIDQPTLNLSCHFQLLWRSRGANAYSALWRYKVLRTYGHIQTTLGKATTIIVRVQSQNAAFAIRDYTHPLRIYAGGVGCIVNA